MSIYEFFIFVAYLFMILSSVVAIQVYNPGKKLREEFQVEDTGEKFVQTELEEPEPETNTNTENTMLRNRLHKEETSPAMEMVD